MDRTPIRELVRELLERKGATPEFADGDALVSSGLLDSVDVLEIVTFLETRYDVDFSRQPFDPDDFDTVDGIVSILA